MRTVRWKAARRSAPPFSCPDAQGQRRIASGPCQYALGYVHNLSQRTALYATAARIDNKNGADLTVGGPSYYAQAVNGAAPIPRSSTGYDLGVRHVF